MCLKFHKKTMLRSLLPLLIFIVYFCCMENYMQQLFASQKITSNNFFLIAGPCVAESEEIVFSIAERVSSICKKLEIPYVFKASYRKANRTSANSFTGIGDEAALKLIKSAGAAYNIPTTTDIHAHEEAAMAAEYVNVLQIPAFLSRQTDLLLAAANTGKIVNVKKGQFLSGPSMKFAADKVIKAGNNKVWLTDRGNTFGYQDIIVDYRNITWMKEIGVPVVMDCTHSLQQPNQTSGVTGGNPQLIETIAKAAIATGADGLFIETHPKPAEAKSDGANMLQLDLLEPLLEKLLKIRQAIV
jgi:2-dehydro-3-deoxyphosphooctonate aldolase (KDO 8-P synthase)